MNTLHKIVEPHTPTPAVPEIPALVQVPHSMTASQSKRYAALAINSCAKRAALHVFHVSAINSNACKTVLRALNDAYIQIGREMRTEYKIAQINGGLLYAWHGTKAFEVQE